MRCGSAKRSCAEFQKATDRMGSGSSRSDCHSTPLRPIRPSMTSWNTSPANMTLVEDLLPYLCTAHTLLTVLMWQTSDNLLSVNTRAFALIGKCQMTNDLLYVHHVAFQRVCQDHELTDSNSPPCQPWLLTDLSWVTKWLNGPQVAVMRKLIASSSTCVRTLLAPLMHIRRYGRSGMIRCQERLPCRHFQSAADAQRPAGTCTGPS